MWRGKLERRASASAAMAEPRITKGRRLAVGIDRCHDHARRRYFQKDDELLKVSGLELEVERRGRGQPLLVLYGEEALELEAPVLTELAKDYELIIPSPPGFGTSERPDWIKSPDDIAYIYLDLIDPWAYAKCRRSAFRSAAGSRWKWRPRTTASVRSWCWRAPMASRSAGLPIAIFRTPGTSIPRRRRSSSGSIRKKANAISVRCRSAEPAVVARNNRSFSRFCWDPCLHNPKLKRRLHRVRVPTLFVWGEHDGIVTPDYGKAFSRMIPRAKFAIVKRAGHYPHLEQPKSF